jgi:hypothetical protein
MISCFFSPATLKIAYFRQTEFINPTLINDQTGRTPAAYKREAFR